MKVNCHNIDLQKQLSNVSKWKITKEHQGEIQDFIFKCQTGGITGKVISESSCSRYLYSLKILLENIRSHEPKSIEDFKNKILKGTIGFKSKRYGDRTIIELFGTSEQYLSFIEPKHTLEYKKILGIKLNTKKDDFEITSEKETLKLIDGLAINYPLNQRLVLEKSFIIALAYVSGMRAQELFNIRLSDITLPTGSKRFVEVRIKNQFSKTKGRTIQLYDSWVLPYIKNFVALRIQEGVEPEAPLITTTYYTNRNWLQDYSKKVLKKPINFHMYRHSLATRLSSKLNRQQLCIYFGWSFSSPMVDIYIQRAGVDMQELENKFEKVDYEKQQEEIKKLKLGYQFLAEVLTRKNTKKEITLQEVQDFLKNSP